jgi:hypothetical protein
MGWTELQEPLERLVGVAAPLHLLEAVEAVAEEEVDLLIPILQCQTAHWVLHLPMMMIFTVS